MSALDALLDELAERVAAKLLARQQKPETYSQDAPPLGMTKRAYLDHCRAGDWPSRKMGRLRLSSAADVDAWVAKRSRTKADDTDSDDELFARISRPAKRGRRAS